MRYRSIILILIALLLAFSSCSGKKSYKDEIEKTLTARYLEEFPEYEKTFKVFWVKPDDGARFV